MDMDKAGFGPSWDQDMIVRQPRYSKEEHARRGDAIYEQQVRALVEPVQHGKIVAIDIESGAYEVAENVLSACQSLLAHQPDAQIWCVRIGYPAVYQFGTLNKSVSTIGNEAQENHHGDETHLRLSRSGLADEGHGQGPV
jgi:hypothetical protein